MIEQLTLWAMIGLAFGAGVGFGCGLTLTLALFVLSILYQTLHKMFIE